MPTVGWARWQEWKAKSNFIRVYWPINEVKIADISVTIRLVKQSRDLIQLLTKIPGISLLAFQTGPSN